MKRRVDLIEQFADLVVGADDPRRLAERTLEVVMSLTNGRSGAVFSNDRGRLALFASKEQLPTTPEAAIVTYAWWTSNSSCPPGGMISAEVTPP